MAAAGTPAGVPNRLKQTPIDVWSTREKLALVSSMSKTGDQNWYSVSRPLKAFSDEERPADWFNQKNCAMQFAEMREMVKDEVPKRKRGEQTETAEELIVKKLRQERIEELKKLLEEDKIKLAQNVADQQTVDKGDRDGMHQIWERIKQEKNEQDKKRADYEQWQKNREVTIAATQRFTSRHKGHRPSSISAPSTPATTKEETLDADREATGDLTHGDDGQMQPTTPTAGHPAASPLLTSLLQSPTSVSKSISSAATIGSPTKTAAPSAAAGDETVKAPEPAVEAPPTRASRRTRGQSISAQAAAAAQAKEEPMQTEESGQADDDHALASPTSKNQPGTAPLLTSLLQSPTGVRSPAAALGSPTKTQTASLASADETSKESETTVETPTTRSSRRQQRAQSSATAATVAATPTAATPAPVGTSTPATATRRSARRAAKGNEEEEKPDKKPVVHDETTTDASISEEETTTDAKEPEGSETPSTRASRRVRGQSTSSATPVTTAAVSTPTTGTTTTTPATATRRSARRAAKGQDEEEKVAEVKKPVVIHDEGTTDASISEESTDGKEARLLPTSATPSISDSIPNSPASTIVGDDPDAHREFKRWQKAIMVLWRSIHTHRYSTIFHFPVSDAEAEGYSEIVKRPMDLNTIKKRIENPHLHNSIKTTAEFHRDLWLMFCNAIIYNHPNHDVADMAQNMSDDVNKLVDDFILSQDKEASKSARKSEAARRNNSNERKSRPEKSTSKPEKSSSTERRSEKSSEKSSEQRSEKEKPPTSTEPRPEKSTPSVERRSEKASTTEQRPDKTAATPAASTSSRSKSASSTPGLTGLAALKAASSSGSKKRESLSKAAIMSGKKGSKGSVLNDSRSDWLRFKEEQGISEELKEHTKSKESYVERQSFLHRADQRQFEQERAIRERQRAMRQNQK